MVCDAIRLLHQIAQSQQRGRKVINVYGVIGKRFAVVFNPKRLNFRHGRIIAGIAKNKRKKTITHFSQLIENYAKSICGS